MRIIAGQTKCLQQVLLANMFAGEIFDRISRRYERILGGVPCRVVHTIQNADHSVAAPANYSIQTIPEFGSLDFLRVARADRAEIVGIDNSALQEIHIAIKFECSRIEQYLRNTHSRQNVAPELPV